MKFNVPTKHEATIEDRYKTTLKVKGNLYEIELLDTAGEEDYQNLLGSWVSYADGFLLVFALNDKESLESLKEKKEKIEEKFNIKNSKKIPCILIGNKQDLSSERNITYKEAKSLADKWNMEYMETSALNNFNCKEALMKLVMKIIDLDKGEKDEEKCGCCVY